MKKFLCIERLSIAFLMLWLLTLAPAIAQNVVHQGETTEISVEQMPNGDTYIWELYNDSTVNYATVAGTAVADGDAEFVGDNTGPRVNIHWKEPGLYFIKVTARDVSGCTSNLKVIIIEVIQALPTASIQADTAVCEREPVTLLVTLTGTGPWSFIYTDGTTEWTVMEPDTSKTPPAVIHPIIIDPGPLVTTDYWITSVTDNYGTNTEPSERTTQQVNPLPTPSNIYHQ